MLMRGLGVTAISGVLSIAPAWQGDCCWRCSRCMVCCRCAPQCLADPQMNIDYSLSVIVTRVDA